MKQVVTVVLFFLISINNVLARELPDFTELVDSQGLSVVNISTTQTIRNNGVFPGIPNLPENDPFFEFFRRFAPPQMGPREYQSRSLGSGFIISLDGYILTNSHVVASADEITVKLTDKREFKAKVIGIDTRTDVALIKIEASALPMVSIGDPGKLRVGEWVVAIGSPFGFENSVTAGIVSAKGRSLPDDSYVPFIQTDVAVNPGNSGGPLFNMQGQVIGINSQIYSRTGGFMGLSFAIPIDVAMDVANQLRTNGKVSRGRLGVQIQEVTKELADSFGLKQAAGALIASVEKESPAEKAGLKASDIILKYDNKAVTNSSDLPRLVGTTKPGAKAILQVWRSGEIKNITVAVGETPESKLASNISKRGGKERASPNRLGLMVSELTSQQKKELMVTSGLVVENVEGAAAQAGIQPGDILLAVGNQELKTVKQFNDIVEQASPTGVLALLIKRDNATLYVALKPEKTSGNN